MILLYVIMIIGLLLVNQKLLKNDKENKNEKKYWYYFVFIFYLNIINVICALYMDNFQ